MQTHFKCIQLFFSFQGKINTPYTYVIFSLYYFDISVRKRYNNNLFLTTATILYLKDNYFTKYIYVYM